MKNTLKDILIQALKEVLMYTIITLFTALLFGDGRRYTVEEERKNRQGNYIPYRRYRSPKYDRREDRDEEEEKYFGFAG